MNCKQCREKLSFYVLQELSEEERKSVENHLVTCENCREEYREIEKIITSVSMMDKKTEIPENYYAHLTHSIHNRMESRQRVSWRFAIPVFSSLALIFFAIFFSISFLGEKDSRLTAFSDSLNNDYVISYLDESSLPPIVSDSDYSQMEQTVILYLLTSEDFFLSMDDWVEDVSDESFNNLVASLENFK